MEGTMRWRVKDGEKACSLDDRNGGKHGRERWVMVGREGGRERGGDVGSNENSSK